VWREKSNSINNNLSISLRNIIIDRAWGLKLELRGRDQKQQQHQHQHQQCQNLQRMGVKQHGETNNGNAKGPFGLLSFGLFSALLSVLS
jgi:hypothetical protein